MKVTVNLTVEIEGFQITDDLDPGNIGAYLAGEIDSRLEDDFAEKYTISWDTAIEEKELETL